MQMNRRLILWSALASIACGSLAGYITFATLRARERAATEGVVRLGSRMDVQWGESTKSGAGYYSVWLGSNQVCHFSYDGSGAILVAGLSVSDAGRSWTLQRTQSSDGSTAWSWVTESPLPHQWREGPMIMLSDLDNDGVPDQRSTELAVDGATQKVVERRDAISWLPVPPKGE
jgi:hypothetical protein